MKLDHLGEFLLSWRVKTVLPFIKGRLLDIGCGTNRLVREYGNGVGVDVFQFGDADIIVSDTSHLEFPDCSFDTVTIIAALNHIPNREAVLKESRRLLKADGSLILTMIPPIISRFWHKFREHSDRDQHERGMQEGEVFGFTHEQIRNLLAASGFKLVREKSFMFGLNHLYIAKLY